MNHIRLCLEEIEDDMARIYSSIKKHLRMEIYYFHKSRSAISIPQSSDNSSINTQDYFRKSADFFRYTRELCEVCVCERKEISQLFEPFCDIAFNTLL